MRGGGRRNASPTRTECSPLRKTATCFRRWQCPLCHPERSPAEIPLRLHLVLLWLCHKSSTRSHACDVATSLRMTRRDGVEPEGRCVASGSTKGTVAPSRLTPPPILVGTGALDSPSPTHLFFSTLVGTGVLDGPFRFYRSFPYAKQPPAFASGCFKKLT